jgi:hypothetical protein
MPHLRGLTFACAALALACLAPAAARAESIVITGGTYVVRSSSYHNLGSMTNGSNFSVEVNGQSNVPPCVEPASGCRTGAPMSPSFGSGAFNAASLVYNGVGYSSAAGDSIGTFFQFSGPGFTPVPGDASTWEVPFTFSGGVILYRPDGDPLVFTLTGSGVARFELLFSEFGFVQGRSATYTFQPHAVPEPATLILFGAGAAALASGAGRRRRTA